MLNPTDYVLLVFIGLCLIWIAGWTTWAIRNETRHRQRMINIWASYDAQVDDA